MVAGQLRLEFDGRPTARAGALRALRRQPPHRLGAERGTTEVLVVAADAPNDFRNHPLFIASISRPLRRTAMTMLAELEGTGEKFSLDQLMDVRAAPAGRCT